MNPILEHHKWANLRMIDFCRDLTDEQLALTVPGTFGGTLQTLRHVIANEAHYLTFIAQAPVIEPYAQRGDFTGWDALRSKAVETADAWLAVARTIEGDPIQRNEWEGEVAVDRTSLFFAQVIDHGTEHRGHNRTTLSAHGIAPPEIDGRAWSETSGWSGVAGPAAPLHISRRRHAIRRDGPSLCVGMNS